MRATHPTDTRRRCRPALFMALAVVLVGTLLIPAAPAAATVGGLVGRLVYEGVDPLAVTPQVCIRRLTSPKVSTCVRARGNAYHLPDAVPTGQYQLSVGGFMLEGYLPVVHRFSVTSSTRVLPTATISVGKPITGLVKDVYGRPVVGAVVSARSEARATYGAGDSGEEKWTHTDLEGRFAVPARPGWTYTVSVAGRYVRWGVRAGEDLVLRMPGKGASSLTATLLTDEERKARLEVEVHGPDAWGGRVTVVEDGRVVGQETIAGGTGVVSLRTLPAGRHVVWVVFSGTLDQAPARIKRTLTITQPLPSVSDTTIVGQVRRRDGRPAKDVTVRAVQVPCGAIPRLPVLDPAPVRSRSESIFQIPTHPLGCYDLSATVDGELVRQRAVAGTRHDVVLMPKDTRAVPTHTYVRAPSRTTSGTPATIKVGMQRATGGRWPVQGKVVLMEGTRALSSATLGTSPVVELRMPRTASVGTHTYRVVFRPAAGFGASQATATVTVAQR